MDREIQRVFGENVLLRIEKAPAVSKGGIYDPRAGDRITPFGTVVLKGEMVMGVAQGDIVYYDLHEGTRIGDDQIIIKEKFLYGKVTE